MHKHAYGLVTVRIVLALALVLASATPAYADPGREDPYVITDRGQVMSTTTIRLPATRLPLPELTTTNGTYVDTLPGGVTAWSTSGIQWQESCCLRWVWGLTKSETSTAIQEIETHGALINGASGTFYNCYEGSQKWTPSLVLYNTSIADSGWGPGGGSQTWKDSSCWIMASGHYYIYNGTRTDVLGPDTRRDF